MRLVARRKGDGRRFKKLEAKMEELRRTTLEQSFAKLRLLFGGIVEIDECSFSERLNGLIDLFA